jgi:hypothetical protein
MLRAAGIVPGAAAIVHSSMDEITQRVPTQWLFYPTLAANQYARIVLHSLW